MKLKDLLWLLLACATIFILSTASGYALVIKGIIPDGGPIANAFVFVGYISFVIMPASILFFIILSAQRAMYSLHPPTFRKYIPYWRWLETGKDKDIGQP